MIRSHVHWAQFVFTDWGKMSVNPYQSPAELASDNVVLPDGIKRRHGCVTAWLIFNGVSVGLSWASLVAIKALDLRVPQVFELTPLYLAYVVASGILMWVFIVALWKFKLWGFYGWIGMFVIGAIGNLVMGLEWTTVLASLIGVAILYGILQLGRPSTWSQLE